MTDNKKVRALFLSALMVFSVFAGAVALTGSAAAANRGAGSGTYDTGPTDNSGSDSQGQIGDGEVIFQGEEGITFVDSSGNTINPASLERTGGASEGVPLQVPVPEDQAIGTYSTQPNTQGSGFEVTVQTPRINTLEVQNNGGSDVSGGVLTTDQQNAQVFVEYDFAAAEDVELTVEDENGLDVTDEIVDSGSSNAINGDGSIPINPAAVDSGEYTFTVEGTDDLDFGAASESVTVNISDEQTASLNLDRSELVQGEDNQVTVENSPEGSYHAIVIESDEFRNGINREEAGAIFRSVGDTTETGVVVNDGSTISVETDPAATANVDDVAYAYAIVEIDGGNGVASIESQYLDDSTTTVDLYPATSSASTNYAPSGSHAAGEDLTTLSIETDDDQDFEVTEGEVSLTSPTGTYVTGSSVDVSGEANPGVDEVAIYARDNNQFELVTIDSSSTISVDSDDSFEETSIELSAGSSILQLPGTYRLGVIDAQDADTDGDGNVDGSLSTSDFNSGVSSTSSIRVTETELTGSFVTYNNQVATSDNSIDVEGTAPGKSSVVVAFVGQRGNAEAYEVSVDDDGNFSQEDLSLGQLSEGVVTGHVLSTGRDGTFGTTGEDESQFANTIETNYAGGQASGEQVRAQIVANTVDDTGSDDLIINSQFRKTDSLTTIESVTSPVEGSGTLTVVGQTNRVADDNTITVELLNSDEQSIAIDSTDEWNTTGTYTVELNLDNVEPGTYTVEADDGDNTDRTSVEVVENVQEPTTPTEPSTPSTPSTPTDPSTPMEPSTPMDTATATSTPADTTDADDEATETATGGSGPGFTAAIALIALVAAALLAVRRNN